VAHHLVIFKKPYLDLILAGEKTVESRLARTKRPLFGRVAAGDTLFLKQSCGPVCAVATAAAVKHFAELTPGQITTIKQQYNRLIKGDDDYWQGKADCKFALLVWLKDVRPIEPVRIPKRDWRAWVVLTEKQNFGLLPPAAGVVNRFGRDIKLPEQGLG